MFISFYKSNGKQSINSNVKQCYNENNEHFLVAARRQTGGKGRNGRSFVSEDGGAYFSFSFSLGSEDVAKQLYGSGKCPRLQPIDRFVPNQAVGR